MGGSGGVTALREMIISYVIHSDTTSSLLDNKEICQVITTTDVWIQEDEDEERGIFLPDMAGYI